MCATRWPGPWPGSCRARITCPGGPSKAALFPENDPTLRQATPATVSGLTLDDVKDYFGHVFRPDMTAIVVIGNVTPAQAKAVVEQYFGGWQASGPKPNTSCRRCRSIPGRGGSAGCQPGPGQGRLGANPGH